MSNIHSGHRSRLRLRAEREGLAAFQPHEVLELFLYHALPRRNLNPLAHALIRRFGSVGAVLAAGEDALRDVPGIGGESAAWLGLLHRAARRYAAPGVKGPTINRLDRALEICRVLFARAPGQALVLSLDASGRLLQTAMPALALQALVEPPVRSRAQCALLALWHDGGDCTPREEEVELAREYALCLSRLEILVPDILVLSPAGHLSLRRAGWYRIQGDPGPLWTGWLEDP